MHYRDMSAKASQADDAWAVKNADGDTINTFEDLDDARRVFWVNHECGHDVVLVDPSGEEHTPIGS